MKNLPRLNGKKVYLGPMPNSKPFHDKYLSWVNSDRVRVGFGNRRIFNVKEILQLLRIGEQNKHNWTFGIYDVEEAKPIGEVSIRSGYETFIGEGPETVIMLGENYGQGKGYEAMCLILDYAFDTLSFSNVNLVVFIDNVPAVKLYKKLGFQIVDQIDREYVMTLTKEAWNANTTKG